MATRTASATPLLLAALLLGGLAAPALQAQYQVLWWDNSPHWGVSMPDALREEMSDYLDSLPLFDSTYVSSEVAGELAVQLANFSYDVIVFDSAGVLTFDAADRAAITTHYAAKPHLLLDGTFTIRNMNIPQVATFPGPGNCLADLTVNEVWQLATHGGGMLIGTDHFGFSDPANDVLDQCVPAADFTGATEPSHDGLFLGADLIDAYETFAAPDLFQSWEYFYSQGIAPTGSFLDVFGEPVALYPQLSVADAPGGGPLLCYISTSWPPSGPSTSFDCDGNGIPDNIDLEYGWLQDDDGDGVPDDCTGTELLLYTVTDQNVLAAVDVDNGCTSTSVGVTQDSSSGPVRKLRGLAHDPLSDTMYGITREGDLVTVDRSTATTTHLLHLPWGDPATEFWSGLAFDGVDTLYTANAFDDHEFVAITLGTTPTPTLVGSTLGLDLEEVQLTGLAWYPPSAPLPVDHPATEVLWVSYRQGDTVGVTDPWSGLTALPWGPGPMGVDKGQALTFHPGSGVLYTLHDHVVGGTNAALSSFDFVTGLATELCELPFGTVETGGQGGDTFGWGGLTFAPAPGVWIDQGGGLGGTTGVPVLTGTGTLVVGTINGLTLQKAAADAPAMLFYAFGSSPVPFKGGTLLPFPDPGLLPAKTSDTGAVELSFAMPAGVPPGTELWTQWAIQDAGAPQGVALSNGVLGVTP